MIGTQCDVFFHHWFYFKWKVNTALWNKKFCNNSFGGFERRKIRKDYLWSRGYELCAKTLWKAQITSLCSRYHRLSDWTDMWAISNDFLTAVLIGCLPDDQSATVFAKSCNWKVLFSPFQIARFYLSFFSVLSYIKPIKVFKNENSSCKFNGKVQLLIAEGKTKLFSSIWRKHHVKKAITVEQRKPSLSRDRGLDLPAIYNPLLGICNLSVT